MKYSLLLLLTFCSFAVKSQSVYQKWTYKAKHQNTELNTIVDTTFSIEVEKDTMIGDKLCKKVLTPYKLTWHKYIPYACFYEEGDKIYVYDEQLKNFVLMYDYGLSLGDTVFFGASKVSIDSVSEVTIGEKLVKQYHVNRMYYIDLMGYVNQRKHTIIEGLGSDLFYFMYTSIGESACLCEDFYDTKLIAYENDSIRIDSIDFEADFLKVDVISGVETNLFENVQLANNIGNSHALMTGLVNGNYAIEILSLDGKTLSKESKSVNSNSLEIQMKNLKSGFCLIKLSSEDGFEKMFRFYKE